MFQKHNRFYADWRDKRGIRHRRAFTTEEEAQRYKDRRKQAIRPKADSGATRSAASYSPKFSRGTQPKAPKKVWETHGGYAAKALIAEAGSKAIGDLERADILRAAATWINHAPDTRYKRVQYLRAIIRWLVMRHGAAEPLIRDVPKVPRPALRVVTATVEERRMILEAANPSMRCYLLLCSDLAMRSDAAATICPNNYDKEAGTVTFKTKYDAQLTLPVTRELAELFETDDLALISATSPCFCRHSRPS